MKAELTDKYVVINSSAGFSNLTIKNAQKNDTGNLLCSELDDDTEIYSFELIVFGKNMFYGCCIYQFAWCRPMFSGAEPEISGRGRTNRIRQ